MSLTENGQEPQEDQPAMSLEKPDLPPLWSSPAPIGHNGGPSLLRAPGRPSISTPELRERIGDLLCDGVPMAVICRTPGMPGRSTVQRWRRDDLGFDCSCRFAFYNRPLTVKGF